MFFVDLFNFAQLRRRPRWIVPLAIAALLSAAMPAVHQAVFGPDLIAQAASSQIEADVLHRPASPELREMIRSNIADRPLLASGLLLAVVTALLILLSAVVLNLSSLVVGADVTPGQVLAIASVAACAETVLRVLAFAIAATVVAPERVVTFEWMGVGRSNFAFLEGFGATALWTTFVSSIDAVTIVSIAVASIGLMMMDRTLSTLRAATAAGVGHCPSGAGRLAHRLSPSLIDGGVRPARRRQSPLQSWPPGDYNRAVCGDRDVDPTHPSRRVTFHGT